MFENNFVRKFRTKLLIFRNLKRIYREIFPIPACLYILSICDCLRKYPPDALAKAVESVKSGKMSVHHAASKFGVPHSTIEHRVCSFFLSFTLQ